VTEPEECTSLQDVRAAIDRIDRDIVALLGRRRRDVHAAAAFKTDETSVRAPERVAAMLAQRRAWAVEESLDTAFVERLFQGVVAYFTGQELREWQGQQAEEWRH
jgi:isochorismate pyruvate lyase